MATTFLFVTLLCLLIQAFFAMSEMAVVSFNRIRLQYYVNRGKKRAKWLSFLIDSPSRLFGTTLIGVNAMLQLGSECSRRFYESIDLNPDLAPLTQVILVLLFAELIPLFGARRHSEQIAFFVAPFLYFISKLLTPLTFAIDLFFRLMGRLLNQTETSSPFLSREELKMAFEETGLRGQQLELVNNIFTIHKKKASDMLVPLSLLAKQPLDLSLESMKHELSVRYTPYILLYHRTVDNIVAIAYPRDLLRLEESDSVANASFPPWFISEDASIVEVLKQFRTNNQTVAVVLDKQGRTCGVVTLDQIVEILFGEEKGLSQVSERHSMMIERSFDGEMALEEFNDLYDAHLKHEGATTLSELIEAVLKRHPIKGETVWLDRFEITVVETSLLGAKTLSIKTISSHNV